MENNKTNTISPDAAQKDYWRQKEQFADFFNAYLFKGKEIITADILEEKDTDSTSILEIGGVDVTVKGARDSLKVAMRHKGVEYAIIGIEDQNFIHYAMPIKVDGYDAISYERQYQALKKHYNETGELSGNELMSGVKKTDKFTPVVTVVIYFGNEPWDGPISLYDMLSLPEELKPFVNDFRINLVEVKNNDLVFNNQDNRDLFTLLKIIYDNDTDRKTKRTKLEEYSNDHVVDKSVLRVVASTSKSGLSIFDKKEEITVCKLWDEVRQIEGKQEAIIELLEEYGEISDALKNIIMKQEDVPTLKIWHKKAAKVNSIEEFEKELGIVETV